MGKLVDEMFKIIEQEAAHKAEENRLIDQAFPQPEPHVLTLSAEELRGPAKIEGPVLVARTPSTP